MENPNNADMGVHTNKAEQEEKDLSSNSSSNEKEVSTTSDPEFLSGYQLLMVVVAISMAGFLYALDVTVITTAIPLITTQFKTIKDIGWYGSAYLITLCGCAPLMGKIYQYYDSKISFLAFLAIFEIGSLVCGVAPSSTAFIIGRAIAGIGGAGLFAGALTIVAATSSKESRPKNLAMVYVFSMLGTLLGPIIGGLLTERASWRWCFYINLPAGAVTFFVIVFVRIPGSNERSKEKPTLYESMSRLDPIGFALFAPTCIMILLALQWGGSTYSWNSSTIIGLFVGFAATLGAFCVWEHHQGESAMIPAFIMRQRVVYSSCLVTIGQFGSLQVFAYYLPVWFQTIRDMTPIESGGYFSATAGPVVLGTIITGILLGKFLGNPALFALIGNCLGAIGCGLMSTFTPSSQTGVLIGFQILAGFGRGFALQQPVNVVQQKLPLSKISVGSSMVLFCQFFGGALFLALAETDFSNSLVPALQEYAPGVNSTAIFNVGATGVRSVVSSDDLPGVLKAYSTAITNTFYLGAAGSAMAAFASLGMGLKSMKKSKPSEPSQA